MSTGSLLIGCMNGSDSNDTSVDEAASPVLFFVPSSAAYEVRSGPGHAYPIVGHVGAGAGIDVECFAWDRFGYSWYKLRGTGSYINTSNFAVSVPECR